MKKIKNIAIMATSGGAGKDTIADYIVNKLSMNTYYKQALGKPIHEIAEKFVNGSVERHHLQDLGESMRAIFDENVWMRYLDNCHKSSAKGLVIPDVRKLIEFSHYCVEHVFAPLYVRVDRDVAKIRLEARDGGYNDKDLKRGIEKQLNFIEELPSKQVDNTGLSKVDLPNTPFNNVYIINNSGRLETTYSQVDAWWERVIENGSNTRD
ncbi:hypothetical protein [Limosilactobacillus reuteri]|uniref:hypothetical protein n=1 Tax=Limosilactobacillus reuteri TaxID=1598 RepID=UPI001E37B866|nr:hypothetical protein [Limosilactobacillus reuteri]MCC4466445.1 hypothetical protein [Limosilactobacillus reuteri]MCC4474221.1 hypothetical protein [Limosilactobacillus reuteri]